MSTKSSSRTTATITIRSSYLLVLLLLNGILRTYATDTHETTGRVTRVMQRPFLVRNLELFGIEFPFTPITVIILTLSLIILYRGFTKDSTATASHILLDGTQPNGKEKLLRYKKEIGNDPVKFAQYAEKHSACPSGKNNGGSLGKFKQGSMALGFDLAVFSQKNKVGEVLAPVQTNFGWHLILIHERDEQRQLILD